jgi:chemotaxis protein MotB
MATTTEQTSASEDVHQPLLGAKYVSIERRTSADTVFLVDDTPFHSSMPQPTHWSIAWSDLMMTMFVLFLSLFVYKTADNDFLRNQGLEVIGGETADALQTDQFDQAGLPFTPLTPGPPLMTAGKIRKSETLGLDDLDLDSPFTRIIEPAQPIKEIVEVPSDSGFPQYPDQLPDTVNLETTPDAVPGRPQGQYSVEPRPRDVDRTASQDNIQETYRMSKEAVETNDLKKFAAIDIIPDSAIRITLTGDELFTTGQAELTPKSSLKLAQLSSGIQSTPYIINVVGHTDNVPMYSERYASNWELSVARASRVARFLIDDMGMDPKQFVVSGYSSYRPVKPNTNTANREKNRRVEIIISKRLPNPVKANEETLN